MPTSLSPDVRRLAFEAKRLAVETLVKIHLEQVTGAHRLATTHLRVMFTLSLGVLAGVVTLYGAMLRLASPSDFSAITIYNAILAIGALAALVASALLSARALQQAASATMPFLRDPFPNAGPEIDSIFESDDLDEDQILRKLYLAIGKGVESQAILKVDARLCTTLMIVGLLLTGASFLV